MSFIEKLDKDILKRKEQIEEFNLLNQKLRKKIREFKKEIYNKNLIKDFIELEKLCKKHSKNDEGINVKLRMLTKKFPNYTFMSNNIYKLKVGSNLVFIIGTTLWSYIPPDKRPTVHTIMNDYNMTYRIDGDKIRKWNVNDTVKLHSNAVKLIKRTSVIAKKHNAKCILLTHHKPIMDGPKTYHQHCYESNLAHLITSPIIFAAHGHTHKKYMKLINGVPVVSNPRGYPSERTKFDPSFCVEISL